MMFSQVTLASNLNFIIAALFFSSSCVYSLPLVPRTREVTVRKSRRFELPITRHVAPGQRNRRRGDLSGSIGLGNNADLLYTVPIELGNTVAAVHLDTGSSDLWLVTDACTTNSCNGSVVERYALSSLTPAGADVAMYYGDSTTGTFAKGTVALDSATIAGISMAGQAFGAINDTTNKVVQYGTSGIFGLGFPSGSKVQEAVVTSKFGPIVTTDNFVSATLDDGPLLSRISMTNALELPMFSITLSRNTIDIGGQGVLTVGTLPGDINESDLTWVPVRLYEAEDGGLQAPSFAPDEVYPFRWEIDIEGVFLDGQRVPDSTIPAGGGVNSTRVSALIDTGNSLLRGPEDVVDNILSTISTTYDPNAARPVAQIPCAVPRTVSFQIGGKMFPVDPRDFISPLGENDATTCVADNLVSTDAPNVGATFRWSLGDPFLRSNLVAFHYGNLTHPSVDPPRIGILSMVPANANDLLVQAVQDAQNNGGDFEETLHLAPTASAAADGQITVFSGFAEPTGVPLSASGASTSASASPSDADQTESAIGGGGPAVNASSENGAVRMMMSGGLWTLSWTVCLSWFVQVF